MKIGGVGATMRAARAPTLPIATHSITGAGPTRPAIRVASKPATICDPSAMEIAVPVVTSLRPT